MTPHPRPPSPPSSNLDIGGLEPLFRASASTAVFPSPHRPRPPLPPSLIPLRSGSLGAEPDPTPLPVPPPPAPRLHPLWVVVAVMVDGARAYVVDAGEVLELQQGRWQKRDVLRLVSAPSLAKLHPEREGAETVAALLRSKFVRTSFVVVEVVAH